jgi:predicted phosphoadenosine phosphosulfate sulfurtransferase
MSIKRCMASIDVVEAAKIRVTNVFKNGLPVYMSFSGGKDSLSLAGVVMELIQEGKINPEQLTVQFIDEEAIFPCIEKTVIAWRKKFMMVGAKFEWYCLEVKHFCCFNELTEDETFICWDSEKEDVWVRQPPQFAIRKHPLLKSRKDAYQDFLPKLCMDGITLTGVRAKESVQRLQNIALAMKTGKNITNKRQILPIYDWSDKDVWIYLKERNIDIPDIYLYLWQSGSAKNKLRVSQFFSVDTARSLVKMNEYYPNLMDKVIKREPNAYLAALYWDSEMFGRSTKARREMEGKELQKNYKEELLKMFNDMDTYFTTDHKKNIATRYKNFFLRIHSFADERDYKDMYEGLISGDPKLRTYRALFQRVYSRYIDSAKKERQAKLEGLNE